MNAPTTDKLALPFLQPGQALKTITHNEALQRLDTGLYLSCSNMNASELPATPEPNETLILSDATESEHAGDIGVFQNGVWLWFTPKAGWSIWDAAADSLRIYDGGAWVGAAPNTLPETMPLLGLNSAASETQRLAVASESSLFTHDGQSHRISINRAAETDTASLILQTNYAGEAELGLTGSEGFSLKTSPDGANWTERLSTPKDFAGIRAPAFGSMRLTITNDTALFLETPDPTVNRSGLIAYDTGTTPTLVELAKTNRIELHGPTILDGSISAEDNLGLSAVDGGLYVENRLNSERIISLTFLC